MATVQRIGTDGGRIVRRSWRDKLVIVHKAVAIAEDERRRVFREANDAGVSLRAIQQATGVPYTTVGRWIGRDAKRDAFAILDAEAPDG